MIIEIPQMGVVKKQNIDLDKDVSIIYGYNNSGKTTILKAINHRFYSITMEKFLLGEKCESAVYIPTNRINLSNIKTETVLLKDIEEFINYQKDIYKDYGLHLKKLRDEYMYSEIIKNYIGKTIEKIFGVDISAYSNRLSDGIENVINIYLSIIWPMIWDIELSVMSEKQFKNVISEKQLIILIDEIEMFLHVNIQSKLIKSLKEDFKNCKFVLTTHSPLLLTRYKEANILNIEKGILETVNENLYYEDLDAVYEFMFQVEEIPAEIKEDINYLGDIIMRPRNFDLKKINSIAHKLELEYPNLSRRYNKLVLKAQTIGERNDWN